MNRDQAESFSYNILEWLASDAELMASFLTTTGIRIDSIHELMQSSDLQLAVVEFVLQSDQTVLACAAALGCPPERIAQARSALPGGEEYHWT